MEKDTWNRGRGILPNLKGSKHPFAKLTEEDVRKMRELRGQGLTLKGLTLKEIASHFPQIKPVSVKNIFRTTNRGWKHVKC